MDDVSDFLFILKILENIRDEKMLKTPKNNSLPQDFFDPEFSKDTVDDPRGLRLHFSPTPEEGFGAVGR